MAIDLDDTMILGRASRYSRPENGDALLPRVYGNWLDPLAVPQDNADGGLLPAVNVSTDHWVFLINDGPLADSIPPPVFFANDTRIQPFAANGTPVYAFNPNADFEGVGHAAAFVQFAVDPGTRQIRWRGFGTLRAGLVVTNPITAIMDAFEAYGAWTANDFDLPITLETLRALDTLGLQIRWVFHEQRTYREWLNEICRCYHLDYFETAEGKLALQLDRGIWGFPVSALATVDAQTDLDGTEDDVEFEVDQINICNTLEVHRRLKWTTSEYTDAPIADFRASQTLYGTLRESVTLPALYTDAEIQSWVNTFFLRYGFLPAIVRFTVRGLSLLTALPGVYLGFTWPWFGWTQPRLLKVLNQEVDDTSEAPRIHFECFDCQRFVTDTVTLPSTTVESVRRRPRVEDTSVDLTPPAAATNLVMQGSYRRIVASWNASVDLDYDYTEIWVSNENNRATAIPVVTGGHSVSPGGPCQQTWDLSGDDPTVFYFWLMTVDQSGNGKNGTGNWHPASATAGVPAQAEPVNTGGLALDALTTLYGPHFTLSGPTTGEVIIAITQLPATPATGSIHAFGSVSIASVPSQHIWVLRIVEGSPTGFSLGQAIFSNTLSIATPLSLTVTGPGFIPAFGANYVLTSQVITPSGGQATHTISSAILVLEHRKR